MEISAPRLRERVTTSEKQLVTILDSTATSAGRFNLTVYLCRAIRDTRLIEY